MPSDTPQSTSAASSAESSDGSLDGGPERTADGHHIIVKGRKWRATDPVLPADVLADLKSALGRARSGVRNAGGAAQKRGFRERVQLAKKGLGERGEPWWELSQSDRISRARDRLERIAEREAEAR